MGKSEVIIAKQRHCPSHVCMPVFPANLTNAQAMESPGHHGRGHCMMKPAAKDSWWYVWNVHVHAEVSRIAKNETGFGR